LGLGHSGLDVDSLHVVPSLLKEGDQEVQGHVDVLSEFFVIEVLSSDWDGEAGNFLKLELDGGLDTRDLVFKGIVMGNDGGEHLNSVKDWSQNDWDLLNQRVSGEEHGVFLGPLLDEFLVLVELLELIEGGHINVDSGFLDFVGVLGISNKAQFHVWSNHVWKLDGS
jgi:hypothetical protein